MSRLVAAVFAHPDDEVLGCGAAVHWHASRGDRVAILILATGLTSRGPAGETALAELRGQAEAAAKVLGAQSVAFADFPDNAMDSLPLLRIVQRVEKFLQDFPAEVIYTHHAGDLNVDHRVTHEAVMTARRLLPGAKPVEIYGCEVNSATEWGLPSRVPFVPTDFLDAGDHIAAKVAALECYSGEIRDWPHPRSAEGVRVTARFRGMQCGRDAAEAYRLVRRLRA